MPQWISRGDYELTAEQIIETINEGQGGGAGVPTTPVAYGKKFTTAETFEVFNSVTKKITKIVIDATQLFAGAIGLVSENACMIVYAGEKDFFIVETSKLVLEAMDGGSWNVASAVFLQDVAVPHQTNPSIFTSTGLFFSPDGTKMFIVQFRNNGTSGSNLVYKYDLSTPWDISTAVFSDAELLNTDTTSGTVTRCLHFSSDGKYLYFVVSNGSSVSFVSGRQLLTHWDTEGGFTSDQIVVVTTQDIAATGVALSSDGKKMYVCGNQNDKIYEYDLSTPWDVETRVFKQDIVVTSSPKSIFFRCGGAKMYLVDSVLDTVREYDLSTPWDISTLTFLRDFNISTQDGMVEDVYISPDGGRLYILGSANKKVYQYDLAKKAFSGVAFASIMTH